MGSLFKRSPPPSASGSMWSWLKWVLGAAVGAVLLVVSGVVDLDDEDDDDDDDGGPLPS